MRKNLFILLIISFSNSGINAQFDNSDTSKLIQITQFEQELVNLKLSKISYGTQHLDVGRSKTFKLKKSYWLQFSGTNKVADYSNTKLLESYLKIYPESHKAVKVYRGWMWASSISAIIFLGSATTFLVSVFKDNEGKKSPLRYPSAGVAILSAISINFSVSMYREKLDKSIKIYNSAIEQQ